jgi:hypothetical protein
LLLLLHALENAREGTAAADEIGVVGVAVGQLYGGMELAPGGSTETIELGDRNPKKKGDIGERVGERGEREEIPPAPSDW